MVVLIHHSSGRLPDSHPEHESLLLLPNYPRYHDLAGHTRTGRAAAGSHVALVTAHGGLPRLRLTPDREAPASLEGSGCSSSPAPPLGHPDGKSSADDHDQPLDEKGARLGCRGGT